MMLKAKQNLQGTIKHRYTCWPFYVENAKYKFKIFCARYKINLTRIYNYKLKSTELVIHGHAMNSIITLPEFHNHLDITFTAKTLLGALTLLPW
jgi:hypothetical protein